jgi:hypothetical protein
MLPKITLFGTLKAANGRKIQGKGRRFNPFPAYVLCSAYLREPVPTCLGMYL